jgi:hypothetical protein
MNSLYFRIPPDALPDTYFIQIDLSYQVNALRTINYTWYSQKFEVVK